MSGITPTNIVPPATASTTSSTGGAPGSGAASASAGVTPIEGSLNVVPEKIQQLTRQIQVGGTIAQTPDAGQVTINTVLGQLTVTLPALTQDQQQKLEQQLLALFQSQKPLTLVVQPGDPPTQALLLVPPSSGSAPETTPQPPANAAVQASSAPQLVPGAILPAVVLLPVDNATLSNSLPNLAAGLLDEAALKAQSVAEQTIAETEAQIIPNAGQTAPPVAPLSGSLAQSLAPSSAAPLANAAVGVAQNTSSLANLFQPGAQLNLTVNTLAPPGITLPAPSLANQISATVIGNGPGGQLLLKAGDATLFVQQPSNVPVGSTLLLTVEAARAAPPTLLPQPDAGNFNTLQQAIAALAQVDPGLARQVLESIIPQPNPALAGALFLLFTAFQQGDARAWLGPSASDILSRTGKAELIAKLSQGLGEAGHIVNDPVVGSWRSYPVPLFNNGQFQTLHFYVHGDQHKRGQDHSSDNSANPGAKSVRFLIDMRLSKLGALQLDGFVRPKQLDMIVRSETLLPPGLDRELRQTYTNTISAIGYAGTLTFQTGRQHWLFIRNPTVAGSVVT